MATMGRKSLTCGCSPKEAKGVDTTSRGLPAVYSDAKRDSFPASLGDLMGSPNLAHPSLSVPTAYTIQI